MRRLVLLALTVATGCSDALEQTSSAGQVVAVSDRDHEVVSLVSATDLAVLANVGTPGRAPISVAGRDNILLVPFGGELGVIDLETQQTALSGVVPLGPVGAIAVTIQDDSIAWTANQRDSTVTRVNYRTASTMSLALSGEPWDLVFARGNVFVVTRDIRTWSSWLSVVEPTGMRQIDSVPLTGVYAHHVTLGGDGLIYVVSSGPLTIGTTEGRVAIVDPVARSEVAVINGLGEIARGAVYHPSGRLLVASQHGILEVNTLTRSLSRGPANAVTPGGPDVNGVIGVSVDQRGRVYVTDGRNCGGTSPGFVRVLSSPPDYRELRTISVSSCPAAAATAFKP